MYGAEKKGEREISRMRIDKKKASTLFALTSLMMSFVFANFTLNFNPVSAQPETTIYIDPTPVTAYVCRNFTVAVNVRDVTDLYAWQFKLSWNPDLLECVGYSFGPFLPPPTVQPTPVIDNTAGWILAGDSRMVPPGVSGSGTIFYIEFHCDGPGACDLVFSGPDTFLLDSNLIEIPCVEVNGLVIQKALTLDVELYPRRVKDLMDPTGYQWHELHPNKTNFYHLTSWEPGRVLSPEDQIDMYTLDPPVRIYLESYEPVDLFMPICTMWHEFMPTSQNWHFSSWEDTNGDGILSPSDQIDMTNLNTSDVVWFHVQEIIPPDPAPQFRQMILDVKYWFQVDEVTVDMTLSPLVPPGPLSIFVEYKCGYWTFDPKNPISTKWNHIDPEMGPVRCLHLTSWIDNDNGVLDPGDVIDMTNMYPYPGAGTVELYSVDFMSISLKLTPKPSPRVVPPPPTGPVYLESAISYDKFDLANPVCTKWHEIYPVYCRTWHLSSWEDNLGLSPSDQIVLTLKDPVTHEPIPGAEAEYHVDKLTVAMNITDMMEETHIVKFEESLKQFKQYHWMEPISTQWHEVDPQYCRQWHLISWIDNGDGILGYCDIIKMIDKVTGEVWTFHVESLSTDMWVTQKICGVDITNVATFHCGSPVSAGYPGWTIQVNVTVHNNGTIPLNCTVNAYYYNATITVLIGTQNITNLAPCNTITLTFNWMLPSPHCKTYTVKANATCLCGASDQFIDGMMQVKIMGDVDGDGVVGSKDNGKLGAAYGSRKGQPKWNPQADFDDDGVVGSKDNGKLGANYGKRC